MKAKCFHDVTHTKIKVSENGRQAIVRNDARDVFTMVRVDGCLITGALAADWIVARAGQGDVVIELKGCDVDHAVDQIEATFSYWTAGGFRNGGIAALIVCSRYPAIDTKVQRARNAFAKKYAAPLHVVTRNCEYGFNALLSFRGPHRA